MLYVVVLKSCETIPVAKKEKIRTDRTTARNELFRYEINYFYNNSLQHRILRNYSNRKSFMVLKERFATWDLVMTLIFFRRLSYSNFFAEFCIELKSTEVGNWGRYSKVLWQKILSLLGLDHIRIACTSLVFQGKVYFLFAFKTLILHF